jgi:hypothetical protein
MTVLIGAANAADPSCDQYSTLPRLPDRFMQVTAAQLGRAPGSGKPTSAELFVLTDGTCTCKNKPSVDRYFYRKDIPTGVNWSCQAADSEDREYVEQQREFIDRGSDK